MHTRLISLLTLAALLGHAPGAHAHIGDEIYPYTVRVATFEKGENGNLGTEFAAEPPGSQRGSRGARGGLGRAAQAVSNSCMTES